MLINPDTMEIPKFQDVLNEHAEGMKEILEIPNDKVLASESIAGQMVQNFAKADYEMFLSFQVLLSAMDARTAIGYNLDTIANIRGLSRIDGESDEDLRKRITGYNKRTDNHKKKDLLLTQLENITGVTKANVIYKDGDIWVIVSGGEDKAIAEVLRDYSPLGEHRGNNTIFSDCQEYNITRAVEIPVKITITVNTKDDLCICKQEDVSKIVDLVIEKSCDYTAGSAIKESHFKQMLGLEGYNIDSVYFEVQNGKMLYWDDLNNIKEDPCDTSEGGCFQGGWDDSCWDNPCKAIQGKNVLLPNTVIPVWCPNLIVVREI